MISRRLQYEGLNVLQTSDRDWTSASRIWTRDSKHWNFLGWSGTSYLYYGTSSENDGTSLLTPFDAFSWSSTSGLPTDSFGSFG